MRRWSPHPFTLRQLQYVLAVAEYGAFAARPRRVRSRSRRSPRRWRSSSRRSGPGLRAAAAARRRHRGGRHPPRFARAYAPRADDLVSSAERARDPFAGALHIGVIPTVAPYLLPEVARCSVRATRAFGFSGRGEDHRDRGAPDVRRARGRHPRRRVRPRDLEHEPLGRDPFFLALPTGHRLARAKTPARPTSSKARRCSFSTMVTAFEIRPGRVPAGRSRRSERARDEPLDARPDGRWWRRDHAAPADRHRYREPRARTRHTSVRRATARRERSPWPGAGRHGRRGFFARSPRRCAMS